MARTTASKTLRFEFIHLQIVLSIVFVLLMLLLPNSTNYLSVLSAEAQTSLTTNQDDQMLLDLFRLLVLMEQLEVWSLIYSIPL